MLLVYINLRCDIMATRITYLFLIYKNPAIVLHTCQRLEGEGVSFYVHVDANSNIDFSALTEIPNLSFSDKRFTTEWGSSGLVHATAYCLRRISENIDTDYVILMSESDYPVKTPEAIASYLERKNMDFATATPLPCEHPLQNKTCYWLEGGMRRVKAYPLRFGKKEIASIEPRIINWGNIRQFGKLLIKSPAKLPKAIQMFWLPKRRPFENMPWCGGDQWFILRKSTVDKIVKRINEDNRIMEESENTIVPDEIIFATLINALSPVGQRKNETLRYVHWSSPKAKSPSLITTSDFKVLETQIENPDILFVRKIEDPLVIEYIDSKLQTNTCEGEL